MGYMGVNDPIKPLEAQSIFGDAFLTITATPPSREMNKDRRCLSAFKMETRQWTQQSLKICSSTNAAAVHRASGLIITKH